MIIESLLDTDLYKFTMMQTVLHHFPGAEAEYHFVCRSQDVDLAPLAKAIREEICHYCSLRFTPQELDYLSQYPFFKKDFIEFLRIFELQPRFVDVKVEDGFTLTIKGPWLHTIMFEVPVLAIISELYNQSRYGAADETKGLSLLHSKFDLLHEAIGEQPFSFSDFGTRRRFSRAWQRQVVSECVKRVPQYFAGTSNVLFAKEFGVRAIGTMAHEYLEGCQALGPRLAASQTFAFETWAQEYRGRLGIALTDVIGLDAFLHDFDLYFCKLFDGARHDSGCPFNWGDKLIEHYRRNKVDPKTKTLVFSDGLNFPLAIKLYDYFKERAKPVFGVGTNLTNDFGDKALQIVIKMVRCNGQPVAKISDEPSKAICLDESYLSYLKKVFDITT